MSQYWWQILLTLAYGVVGGYLPVLNPEAYLVVSQAVELLPPVVVALVLAIGQGLGKTALFFTIRKGRSLPAIASRAALFSQPQRRVGHVVKRAWDVGKGLIENSKWGFAGAFISGVLSIPPTYPTTAFAAATKVPPARFLIALTLGITVRYVLIALATLGILDVF